MPQNALHTFPWSFAVQLRSKGHVDTCGLLEQQPSLDLCLSAGMETFCGLFGASPPLAGELMCNHAAQLIVQPDNRSSLNAGNAWTCSVVDLPDWQIG